MITEIALATILPMTLMSGVSPSQLTTKAMDMVEDPISTATCQIRWFKQDFMHITCYKDGDIEQMYYYHEPLSQFTNENGIIRMLLPEDFCP